MATRELPKLIFRDDDLPTMRYRRCLTSETDMAVRDVDRSLQQEVREEQVEILGLVSPEAGLAAEIEDICTLDMVESLEVPGPAERSVTPDDLPAIPISDAAHRRAQRRQTHRIVGTVAIGLVLGMVGTLGLADSEPADGPAQGAMAPPAAAVQAIEALSEGPRVVPSPPLIEAVVENSAAPAPASVDRLVAKKALASRRVVRRTGPASVRPPSPTVARTLAPPARRKPRRKRVSKTRLNELDGLLGL